MSIRTVNTSFGPLYYALCNECKTESREPLFEGVHTADALNVAMPHGWTRENVRSIGGAWSKVSHDYCPACSVAPEYRKTYG